MKLQGKTVGERVRFLRESKGYSQRQMVDIMGRSEKARSYYGRCESDERSFSLKDVIAIADHFGVSIDELVR